MPSEPPLSLIKYQKLLKLFMKLKKKSNFSIDIEETGEKPAIRISTDKKSAKLVDSYLGRLGSGKMFTGFAVGIFAGIIAAYFFIPLTASYFYSSKKGLLPPQYDALIRMKNKSEQALQILEHEFEGDKKGGLFRKKRIVFAAPINDSTTIELTYDLLKKGVIKSVSQKKGTKILEKTMKNKIAGTGIDSAAKKYAGMESPDISDDVAEAVTRTTDMKIEKSFRANPVLRIITKHDGKDIEYANFFPFDGKHKKAFSTDDADEEDTENNDHTKYRRKYRVPTTEDQYAYTSLVTKFVEKFFNGDYVVEKDTK
ncbi:MAG: hypothetical protein GF350_11825 [Chitinivibrionales bacterium]|nr:hypothetical protein [Chitinivibrionales bacterium]